MMEKRRIHVTQENIDRGTLGDTRDCMVAIAFHDAGFSSVSVSWGEVCFNPMTDGEYDVYPNDNSLYQRIIDWDYGKPVKPFHFDVTLVNGIVVEIGTAFDDDAIVGNCDDLLSEIEAFLAENKEFELASEAI